MENAPGVAVPPVEAETTRRRLAAAELLRPDLKARKEGHQVIFPLYSEEGSTGAYDFEEQEARPARYAELLPPKLAALAPRSFEHMGDIAIVKVPAAHMEHAADIGQAIQDFTKARVVFHDAGVRGEHRVRQLERIAGEGGPRTKLVENGTTLCVDVSAAYFSPRLATERANVIQQLGPDVTVIDLFAGVGPLAVQAAKRGAKVTAVDVNPAAVALAKENVEANHVTGLVTIIEGDARIVAAELEPAQHVVMNLPHGASEFVDVAAPLVADGGVLHYHEIVDRTLLSVARRALLHAVSAAGRRGRVRMERVVRTYSPQEDHMAFDVEIS